LSRIEAGASLEEAISGAQQLGIAEENLWYDLDGWDAAMKTTILANTLLKGHLTPQEVQREGIRDLSLDNIRAAARADSPFHLVSSAKRKNGIIFAEVRPERISTHDILHTDETTTSVISLETEAMGKITLIEHKPGIQQTAYGVFSDLVTILQHQHVE
jgi:homoserine dehydrogenase